MGTVKGDITSSEHAACSVTVLRSCRGSRKVYVGTQGGGEGREGEGEGGVWRSFPPPHRAGRPLSGVSASKASGKT